MFKENKKEFMANVNEERNKILRLSENEEDGDIPEMMNMILTADPLSRSLN